MIRLEQVRGEMLERFERVDRRFAQNEQRMGRVDQRLAELTDQIEALRQELIGQLELLAVTTGETLMNDAEGRDDEPVKVGSGPTVGGVLDAEAPVVPVRLEIPVEEVGREP